MNKYKHSTPPRNLSFDEASLFWRLRLGEGMPKRKWHKPHSPNKTWRDIRKSLDEKLNKEFIKNKKACIYTLVNNLKKEIIRTCKAMILIFD